VLKTILVPFTVLGWITKSTPCPLAWSLCEKEGLSESDVTVLFSKFKISYT
jgi:hypothetical protein